MNEQLYPHVIQMVYGRPWAIHAAKLAEIVSFVQSRASGIRLTAEDVRARLDEAAARQGPRDGAQKRAGVGVIPVYGVLAPRMNLMTAISGGTSVEQLRSTFRQAMADPAVGAIVLDIDSPGGQVDGIPELAAEIRAARGTKPILASANYDAYSAAYWLATQADEVSVTPSGGVGSVGVLAAHMDASKAEEMEGIKTTLISKGRYKTEANPHEPLTEEARGAIQKDVDAYYEMFVADIAKGRSVPVDTVRKGYGEGRGLPAKEALAAGMVDRIETLEQTVQRAGALVKAGEWGRGISSAFAAGLTPDSPGATVTSDREAVLVAGPTFGERLELVAAEVEAIAQHAQERARWRAEEGKKLSEATRDGLRRLLALRPVLDDVEALAGSPASVPSVLDIFEAYRRGYAIDHLLERSGTHGTGSGAAGAGAREAL